jgi:ribosome maturation factor RimP
MASQPDRELRGVVAPVIEGLGYDLEDLSVAAAGRRHVVRVVVDRDGGFTLDDVADISQELSTALDASDVIPGSYVLEVSSPGVDRPLTELRHWRRNIGRLVEVHLVGGSAVTGRITAADGSGVVLDVTGASRTIALGEVQRARIQIELRPPPGVGTSGAVEAVLDDDAADADGELDDGGLDGGELEDLDDSDGADGLDAAGSNGRGGRD